MFDLYQSVKSMKFDSESWTFPEKLLGAFVSVSDGENKNDLDAAIITIINFRGLLITAVYSGLTS